MNPMMVIGIFGVMLILMLLRVALPIGAKVDGARVAQISLSMRERMRLQRTNLYAIGVMMVIAAVSGDLPVVAEAVVILAVFAILSIPTRYTVTSSGVALNHVVFRPWSDFTHLETTPSRLTLQPQPGLRPFHLVLPEGRQSEAVRAIRRFLGKRPPTAPTRGMTQRA